MFAVRADPNAPNTVARVVGAVIAVGTLGADVGVLDEVELRVHI